MVVCSHLFLLYRKVLHSRSKRMAEGKSLERHGFQPPLFYAGGCPNWNAGFPLQICRILSACVEQLFLKAYSRTCTIKGKLIFTILSGSESKTK